MTLLNYEMFREKYETTKPIRGRAEDIRPIDNTKRRRDHEIVTKTVRDDGTVVYGAQLYQTEVARYLPNGNIQLEINTFSTPITAAFITKWTPFYVYKRKKHLWVSGPTRGKVFPLPSVGHLEFAPDGQGAFTLVDGLPPTLKKQVTHRGKAKELRTFYKPFVTYATQMLKLSDGWVMHETMAPYRKPDNFDWTGWRVDFGFPENVQQLINNPRHYARSKRHVDAFKELITVEDYPTWDRIMLALLHASRIIRESLDRAETFEFYQHRRQRVYANRKYAITTVSDFTNYLIRKDENIYTYKDVEVGCMHNSIVI